MVKQLDYSLLEAVVPVVHPSDAVVHEIHGARFVSYAHPGTGSKELCAWRGEIPAGTKAPLHTVNHEEILHILEGELVITLDGRTERVTAGDTLIINPGATFGAENPTDRTVVTWVTTSIGLTAELADGTRIVAPWAN
jgi:quercetin dioxygenase-like cupin family protein